MHYIITLMFLLVLMSSAVTFWSLHGTLQDTTTLMLPEDHHHAVVRKNQSSSSLLLQTLLDGSELLESRTRRISRLGAFFSFVHIAKCAGAGWRKVIDEDIIPVSLTLTGTGANKQKGRGSFTYPRVDGRNFENPILHQTLKLMANKDNLYTLISVRSPLHHIWSQYSHCRYFQNRDYASDIIKNHMIPENATDAEGFGMWMSLFLDVNKGYDTVNSTDNDSKGVFDSHNHHYTIGNSSKDYNCYHPANILSRALTSREKMTSQFDPKVGFEPNATAAIDNLRRLAVFVSIQEFFSESKCLLYHRIATGDRVEDNIPKNNSVTDPIQKYLDQQCHCPKPARQSNERVVHHSRGKRETLRSLPSHLLAMVAALQQSDTAVYRLALADFLRELSWLESPQGLGRRILCEHTLQSAAPELAYLGVNVTELYHRTKEEMTGGGGASIIGPVTSR